MGKLIFDLVLMLAAGGLGYLFCVAKHFGDVSSKKLVRVGGKFFRITKVEMSEKDVD